MPTDILRDDIEYIIHAEPDGTIIGPISKTHAHMDGARSVLTHHSTWSMVYHRASGRYGLQLKNPAKHDKHGAGKWDMGVAGHNCYVKENGMYRPLGFDETLVKEAGEEIGIRIAMSHTLEDFMRHIRNAPDNARGFIFERFHYRTETDNEWVGLGFIVVPDTDVRFRDQEVLEFRWLSPDELKTYLKTHDDYCAPLPLVFEKAEAFRKEHGL